MKISQKIYPILIILLLTGITVSAQDIVTGSDFFGQVAQNYQAIESYIADIEMIIDDSLMSGSVTFKAPNLMRIDFTDPEEQVLVSDGNIVQVYVPRFDVTLTQTLKEQANPGTIASAAGLNLLNQGYRIAFLNSPNPEPLEPGDSASELVYKLLLTWKNSAQGFREIEMAITPDLFIRRMTAVTSDRRDVEFTFQDIEINISIPDSRFEYDSPPSSNNFDNFLYGAD